MQSFIKWGRHLGKPNPRNQSKYKSPKYTYHIFRIGRVGTGSKDRALLKDVLRPFLSLISVYKKNNMNKEQHYTLTQLIGGNNHKTFKAAMVDLGLLKADLSPDLAKYAKHFSSYTRNNGDVNYKYSKTIVAWVFKQKPALLERFPVWSEQHG